MNRTHVNREHGVLIPRSHYVRHVPLDIYVTVILIYHPFVQRVIFVLNLHYHDPIVSVHRVITVWKEPIPTKRMHIL